MTTTTKTAIETFLRGLDTEIDIMNCIDIDRIDLEADSAFDSIREQILDNNGFDIEIIYYSNAIQYLKENDPSLMTSLEIAEGLGYTPKNINSELLASLLASENAIEKFYDLQDEINEFFNELSEEAE